MFLDSKKRIFGIINILDLFVIVIVLFFVFGGMTRVKTFERISDTNLDSCEIKVVATEVSLGLADKINVGDDLYFSVKGSYFGKVKEFEKVNHSELVTLEDGKVRFMEIPNSYDVYITIDSSVKDDPAGILVSGNQVYIGQENRLKSRYYVFDSMIEDFTMDK